MTRDELLAIKDIVGKKWHNNPVCKCKYCVAFNAVARELRLKFIEETHPKNSDERVGSE